MRALLALAGYALLFVFVATLIGMAAGAIAAPADDIEQLTATDCTELPMRERAFGLVVGERVRSARCAGSIMAFACLSGEPGALLFVAPRDAACAVRVAELVRTER